MQVGVGACGSITLVRVETQEEPVVWAKVAVEGAGTVTLEVGPGMVAMRAGSVAFREMAVGSVALPERAVGVEPREEPVG